MGTDPKHFESCEHCMNVTLVNDTCQHCGSTRLRYTPNRTLGTCLSCHTMFCVDKEMEEVVNNDPDHPYWKMHPKAERRASFYQRKNNA